MVEARAAGEAGGTPRRLGRPLAAALACAAVAVVTSSLDLEPRLARAALVAGLCLVLWLTEVVPPYVPTLLLWSLVPLLMGDLGAEFAIGRVLGWAADPVLALFLGGFALSVAAGRHGIDARLAQLALRLSGGRRLRVLWLSAAVTALMSMWISNIAAAAMMLSALRPLLPRERSDAFRRAMLMSIAIGANFGGMATPIGTGPNGIAIAALSDRAPVTFLAWMTFAVPLAAGLVVAGLALVALRFRVRGGHTEEVPPAPPLTRAGRGVVGVFLATVATWLTEPLHGAPSSVVALLATVALFGSGLLERTDLARIDWSTLGLIAGGITLGSLLGESGLVDAAASAVAWSDVPAQVRILALCFASALLSSLMSNTATATMLIPLAASLDPAPSTAVLVALAASLGMPFAISTPPNAMVHGEGGLTQSDLFVPGIVLMVLGCVLVGLTGPRVLGLAGIP